MTDAAGMSVTALAAAADRAAASGAVGQARDLLEQAVGQDPNNISLQMNLAACCRALGDFSSALAVIDRALAIEPRAYVALLMKASVMEKLGAPHEAGAAYGIALTQAPSDDRLPARLRAATSHAREVHARYETALAESLRESIGADRGGPAARRLGAFIEQLAGKRKAYQQEPTQFRYPGLPAIEFWEREEFPWLEALEAETAGIQAELRGVLSDDAGGLEPYVNYPANVPVDQWAELNRSTRWSSYHLLERGLPVAGHSERCPRTMAAMARLPQPQVVERSPASMFSVLQPHTRIPPHTGVANTRLVLHLPLIVPESCGFRVGNETRQWRLGEAWVFDDTIEHEAWNDSDEVRTILICDIWNPRLSDEEREAIAQVMAAMDAFAGGVASDGL